MPKPACTQNVHEQQKDVKAQAAPLTRQPASYAVAQGSRPAAGPEDPTAGKSAGHGAKGSRGRRPAHDTDLPAPTWRGGGSPNRHFGTKGAWRTRPWAGRKRKRRGSGRKGGTSNPLCLHTYSPSQASKSKVQAMPPIHATSAVTTWGAELSAARMRTGPRPLSPPLPRAETRRAVT